MENITTTTFGPPTPIPTVDPNPTRNALKAVLLITLFFGTFLAGIVCFPLRKYVRSHAGSPRPVRLFSLISCFGAGVFLATCLLDLLPDAVQSVAQAERRLGHPIEFPLPAFCISVGFLLVLLMEQAILYASEQGWIGHPGMLDHPHPPDQEHDEQQNRHENPDPISSSSASDQPIATNQPIDPEQQHLYGGYMGEQHSTMRVYLLVFALSLHAVFEGLSVGMTTDVSAILQIFVALLIHKSIVGFSLGVRLVQSRLRPVPIAFCCAIFAGQVLIGGFTGLAVVDFFAGKPSMYLVQGILQAIACGTFLYITAFEILPHELATTTAHQNSGAATTNRPQKMVALLVGFGLITLFVALLPS